MLTILNLIFPLCLFINNFNDLLNAIEKFHPNNFKPFTDLNKLPDACLTAYTKLNTTPKHARIIMNEIVAPTQCEHDKKREKEIIFYQTNDKRKNKTETKTKIKIKKENYRHF